MSRTPESTVAHPPRPSPTGLRCASCQSTGRGEYHRFAQPGGLVTKCLRCALRDRRLVVHGLKTAALVGTVLTAINQGDLLLIGAITPGVLAKIGLTYLVPYLVSTAGALTATRVQVTIQSPQ